MRIPLLLAANPRHCGQPASIPILAGKWKIILEGVETTRVFVLYRHSPEVGIEAVNGYVFELEDNAHCRVKIVEAGKESMISVYLELVPEEE